MIRIFIMKLYECFGQIAIFNAKELEKEIIIRDMSRARNHIDFKVELSEKHFLRKFEDGETITLFFKDKTIGIQSSWRKKENFLGVEAKVFYFPDQEMPVVMTLGTSYEKNISRKFVKYLPKAIESGVGHYEFSLMRIL